jgi:microcystin-dependent protein
MEGYIAQVIMFAGNFAPRNWAFCQGQLMSIAQNTALFSLLGTTYGGNGQTTFALPDFRGRTPVGTGQGPGLTNITLGEQAGSENATLTINNLPPHNHGIHVFAVKDDPNANSPQNNLNANGNFYNTAAGDVQMKPPTCDLTGGGQPVPIREPYLGMNFVICLFGIFPSRN